MRITHVIALAAAAAASFSASANPGAVTGASDVATVPVVGRTVVHKLKPSEYARLQGLYELSDGRVLEVSMDNGKLYAEVGGKKAEIVHTGPTRFVSRDDALRINFDSVPYPMNVNVSLAN